MTLLMQYQPFCFNRISVGLLVVCAVSPAWGAETLIGSAAELRSLENNPGGHYQLTNNIHLGGTLWNPIDNFTGTLNGNGYSVYGLNLQENNNSATSGLFRYQSGGISNLTFIDSQVIARGHAVYQGLIAGENTGNVTGIVLNGGRMEHSGAWTGTNSSNYRFPLLGVVGRNLASGQVEVLAQGMTQNATGNFARIGIGAGLNYGTAQAMAQNVNQTGGKNARIGIGAGFNEGTGTAQAVAQDVTQTQTGGKNARIGIGAGVNFGTAQAVAQSVTQTQTGGNDARVGIGAGVNYGIAQAVAQNVTQTQTRGSAGIGIGAGENKGTAQAVAQNVIQRSTGDSACIGIGAGVNSGTAQAVAQNVNQTRGGTAQGIEVTEAQLRTYSLDQLGLTEKQEDWITGDNQYPMLFDLDGGYQDMQRLSPEFKEAMQNFTPPSNNTDASWFSFEILRFPGIVTPTAQPVTTQTPATTTSSSNANCLFTPQPTGAIEHLLYDGQRYHGVVKASNGLSYWLTYENDSRLSLEPCGVYDFTALSPSGIVVAAAVNRGNRVYVAYHDPVLPEQTQPADSMLAMLTLLEGQPQLVAADFVMAPDVRITSLSVDGNDVLVNTEQSIYWLPGGNNSMIPLASPVLNPEEVIQSVARNRGDLYLLTHEQEAGYRIRVVPQSSTADSFMVTTPSGVTTSKQVIASLKISGDWLHLLMIDSRSIIWRKYRLDTLASAPDEALQSEAYAALPRDITPAAIALIPDMAVASGAVQDQVFVMGQNPDNQPQYSRLMITDFTSPLTLMPADSTFPLTLMPADSTSPLNTSPGEGTHGISHWPWWGKALLGTGTGLTGMALLATTGCFLKKAWDFQHKHDKLHIQKRARTPFGNEPLPSIPPFFDPGGGSSTMQMTPTATGFVQEFGVEPQAYEEPHIYETIDPATGVTQAEAELPGNIQDHSEACEPWPGLIKIHQLPEQAPDDLDGLELTVVPEEVVPEEPWYANTHPGNIASAPVYTELNKPSAKRALQCLEAQPSQQPGADPLGCVGPGRSSTYFHALVHLEGSDPFSRFGRIHLKVLGKGFDLVFRGMEAVDSYVYDFPPGHPKRTRVHKRRVAEVLYGKHLTTAERFDRRIGDMENPVISFCNAMGGNIWHAFLVFRNSRTGEYNTLHIRQGSYYPEFMDRTATERYFYYEQKKIVGAISLARLTELYEARLDLNLLRDIFRQRLGSKEACYRINNQSCMTFSMLAFWATDFDWAAFLQEMKLANLQSPYHILKALAGSSRNHPAIHSQENNLLPDWLAELNQNEE